MGKSRLRRLRRRCGWLVPRRQTNGIVIRVTRCLMVRGGRLAGFCNEVFPRWVTWASKRGDVGKEGKRGEWGDLVTVTQWNDCVCQTGSHRSTKHCRLTRRRMLHESTGWSNRSKAVVSEEHGKISSRKDFHHLPYSPLPPPPFARWQEH